MGRSNKNSLSEIKKSLSHLSLSELRQIRTWLDNRLEKTDKKSEAVIIDEIDNDGKTYRLQRVRCGKETCKCMTGDLHGPYWYAYWLENGKTKSKYVGKKLHN